MLTWPFALAAIPYARQASVARLEALSRSKAPRRGTGQRVAIQRAIHIPGATGRNGLRFLLLPQRELEAEDSEVDVRGGRGDRGAGVVLMPMSVTIIVAVCVGMGVNMAASVDMVVAVPAVRMGDVSGGVCVPQSGRAERRQRDQRQQAHGSDSDRKRTHGWTSYGMRRESEGVSAGWSPS